ncbi:helix-turn-helix domain-containing protein [Streptomyces sp. CRN 30]|uniref:helix-turn-helix domain-containing protein n=1 Tax=Streptomyces sp. CRN 30 TaxID=3075613 RepID=UPI002A7F2210|nr:helix-turn-helix domain-containing protein [Streptomyces sp. CRN 30]
MLDQPHFGRRLRRLRLERGLSQAHVVGEGMSTGYLSRLESGERPPTERAVAYLAGRLGVDVSVLTRPTDGSLTEVLAGALSAPAGTDSTDALSRALEDDEREDPAARWQALWLLSRGNRRNGDHEQELAQLLEIIELSELLDSPELSARAHMQHARCLRALGRMGQAEPVAVRALAIARDEALSVADTMAALMVLISIETEIGSIEAAGRHVAELERDLLADAAPTQAAEALWTAAMVSNRQGDHTGAQVRLERALDLLEGKDDLTLWARLRAAATAAALQMSPPRVDAAEHWLGEAEPVVELIGTPLQVQELHALQAHLAYHKGDLDEARARCDALPTDDDLRLSYRDRVRLRVLRGQLTILDGRIDEGITLLKEAGRQAADSKNLDLAAHIWQSLATTLTEVRATETTGTTRDD